MREQYCIRTKRSFFPLRRALPPLVLLDTSIPVYNMRVQGSATKGPGTRTVPETEPNLAGERFEGRCEHDYGSPLASRPPRPLDLYLLGRATRGLLRTPTRASSSA